jgi:hypothetical protein
MKKQTLSQMRRLTTQVYPLLEVDAAAVYFLDSGGNLWELTPTEQRKITEEINVY